MSAEKYSRHSRSVRGGRPSRTGVYGSTWITSDAGSVVLLNGKPGDPIVAFHHIKQPASEVGTFKIIHDHDTGRSKTWHSVDLVLLAKQPGGLTALAAAMAIFETDKPTANEKDKAPQKARQTHRPWLPEDHPTGRRSHQQTQDLGGEMTYARPIRPYSCADPMRAVRATLNRPYAETYAGYARPDICASGGLNKTPLRSPERKTRSAWMVPPL